MNSSVNLSLILHKVKELSAYNNIDAKLLVNMEVLQWIYGDLSFLPNIEVNDNQGKKKTQKEINIVRKEYEDVWGRKTYKEAVPDSNSKTQWTGDFGELCVKELFLITGNKDAIKPKEIDGHKLDLEIKDCVIEVKTGTWGTTGSAHEKAASVFKYANVPVIFNKKLLFVCISRAQKWGESKGLFYKTNEECMKTQMLIDYEKKYRIFFVRMTDLIEQHILNTPLINLNENTPAQDEEKIQEQAN